MDLDDFVYNFFPIIIGESGSEPTRGGLMDSDPYYRTTFSVTRYLYITCCVVTLYNISGLSVSQRGTADLSSRVVRMAIDKKTD